MNEQHCQHANGHQNNHTTKFDSKIQGMDQETKREENDPFGGRNVQVMQNGRQTIDQSKTKHVNTR